MDNGRTFINPASLSTTIAVVSTSNITQNTMVAVLRFSRTVFIIGIWICIVVGFYIFAV